ncbi:MAG: hypothetical protein AAF456_11515 [Planctomycetota bacterium]
MSDIRLPAFVLFVFLNPMSVIAQDVDAPLEQAQSSLDESACPLNISEIEADLVIPELTRGEAEAGKRVALKLSADEESDLYYIIYLPTDYVGTDPLPLIVEFPGNRYAGPNGDNCSGLPEDCKLGFGISGGTGAIWLSLPFVSSDGSVALNWWGNAPDFDPGPTVEYTRCSIADVCSRFNVDKERIFLTGFSRGAIACNFIGMHNDEIAALWCGLMPYSHYDGVREWPYPGSDKESAQTRMERIDGRPQFVMHENMPDEAGLPATRRWLEENNVRNCAFLETGFSNHNDAWVLRPSPARQQLRLWFSQHTQRADK